MVGDSFHWLFPRTSLMYTCIRPFWGNSFHWLFPRTSLMYTCIRILVGEMKNSSLAKLPLSQVAWGLSLQFLVYNIYLELYSFWFLQWCNGHYISPVSYKIDLRIYIYSLYCDKKSIYNWMYASLGMLKPALAMHEKQSH